MKNRIEDLKTFYNSQAQKFSGTRKRYWPEFDYIIGSFPEKETLDIIELGCGDGRFYGYMKDKKIHINSYQGIDFSQGLIDIARKEYPNTIRTVDDMIAGMQKQKSESCDVIIAIASFQHLHNTDERSKLLKECYRVLRYGGKIIMTNRSFSRWFLFRFRNEIAMALWKSFVQPEWMHNDIIVPWHTQDKSEVFHRYYHIFHIREIRNLYRKGGFTIEKSGYITKPGTLAKSWRTARNSFIVGKKIVFM